MTEADEKLIEAVSILRDIETDLRGHGNSIYRADSRSATGFFRRANAVQDVLAYVEQALSTGPAHDAGLIEAMAQLADAIERSAGHYVIVDAEGARLILQALAGTETEETRNVS